MEDGALELGSLHVQQLEKLLVGEGDFARFLADERKGRVEDDDALAREDRVNEEAHRVVLDVDARGLPDVGQAGLGLRHARLAPEGDLIGLVQAVELLLAEADAAGGAGVERRQGDEVGADGPGRRERERKAAVFIYEHGALQAQLLVGLPEMFGARPAWWSEEGSVARPISATWCPEARRGVHAV